jgi:hypothetical protein
MAFKKVNTQDRKSKINMVLQRLQFEKRVDGMKAPWADVMEDYEWYKTLSYKQIKTLERQWDEYYQKCRNTESYMLFKAAKKAYALGNVAEVKDIAKRAGNIVDSQDYSMPKPSREDPRNIITSGYVQQFINLTRELKDLNTKSEFGL